MARSFTTNVAQYSVPTGLGKKVFWLVELFRNGDEDLITRVMRYGYEEQEDAINAAENARQALNGDSDERWIRNVLELNYWNINYAHNYLFFGHRPTKPGVEKLCWIDRVPNVHGRYRDFGYGELIRVTKPEEL